MMFGWRNQPVQCDDRRFWTVLTWDVYLFGFPYDILFNSRRPASMVKPLSSQLKPLSFSCGKSVTNRLRFYVFYRVFGGLTVALLWLKIPFLHQYTLLCVGHPGSPIMSHLENRGIHAFRGFTLLAGVQDKQMKSYPSNMEKVSADTLNNQTLCNMVVSWVIGVPPNHPYFSGILTNINQPAIGGTPMTMETPYVSQQKILVISLIHSQFRITTTLMLPIQWIWNPQKHHPNTMAICPMIDAKTIIFSPFLLNTHRYFHCLVVWNMLDFSIYWISNNPNWQNHIFQRGGSTTYQRGWNLMKLYNGDQLLHCNSVNTIMEVVFFFRGLIQPSTSATRNS